MKKMKFMPLQNVEVISREQQKRVFGGSGEEPARCHNSYTHCYVEAEDDGNCETNSNNKCVCNNGKKSVIASSCVL